MKRLKTVLFFALLVIVPFTATAAGEIVEETDSEDLSFMALPIAFYTTDTGFGGGFGAFKAYHPERERISNIAGTFVYTKKHQVSIVLKVDHYLKNGSDRLLFDIEYQKYPSDFFGLGNNTGNDDPASWTPEFVEAKLGYEKKIAGNFRVKANMIFMNLALITDDPKGSVAMSGASWPDGRLDYRAGLSIMWDSRDNLYATKTGTLAQISYMGSLYQSDGNAFNTSFIDLRHFRNPKGGIVLASMILLEDARGDIPFYELSDLGGQDRLRGYEWKRFRDRSMLLFQQDVRFPIYKAVGGAVFCGTGRVADSVDGLTKGTYHTAYGAGVRYFFNRKENMAIRCDVAYGDDSDGLYITFSEAF